MTFLEIFHFIMMTENEKIAEKKLYGRRASNLMKTDIKETEEGYELDVIFLDLPKMKSKVIWRMVI